MADALEITERPDAAELYMIAGWRQWADAGSISSGLPQYLIQQTKARRIGSIRPDGFYLFQIPGTHDLVRPTVRFNEGYPISLETRRNELYYAGDERRGMIFFIGDEPHLDVERYAATFLEAATTLGVRRIIGLGGVYAEVPYDKERMISSIYSLHELREELDQLVVELSDYRGGASIGSYLCRRAGDMGLEYVSFYGFAPTYDFGTSAEMGSSIRLENDFVAWLGIMRRINHMLKLNLDLADLEEKSKELVRVVRERVEEMDSAAPELGVRDFLKRISDSFNESPFEPLDAVWEEELRHLFEDFDQDDL